MKTRSFSVSACGVIVLAFGTHGEAASPIDAAGFAARAVIGQVEVLQQLAREPATSGRMIIVPSRQAPSRPVIFGRERAGADAAAAPLPQSTPSMISGAIEVPNNTLGPGEPLWVRRERESAETRIRIAQAEQAESLARSAEDERDGRARYFGGGRSFGGGGFYGGGGFINPGWNVRYSGGRGIEQLPPSGTVQTFNGQFDSAQRAFNRASQPPIGGIVGGALDAQRKINSDPFRR